MWKSDVFVRDKQNVDAAKRLLQPAVRDCLIKSNLDSTRGLRAYLSVGSCLLRCYADNEISVRERAKLAWTPVIFFGFGKYGFLLNSTILRPTLSLTRLTQILSLLDTH